MKLIIIFVLISLSFTYNYEDFKQINNADELNSFVQHSPFSVLILIDKLQCNNENSDKCQEQRSQLEQIRDLCNNENIQFAISTNTFFAEKYFNAYGSLPKIYYFRNGFPIMYSGSKLTVDDIQEWLGEARQRLTHTLDDRSFEHDTQAATGSTTGDWFVLFKNSNESNSLIPIWEELSLQFRNRAIFAYVNIDANRLIQERFHIFNLPAMILFKRGKMYRYESTSWQQTAFIKFIENDYQTVKSEIVPPEIHSSPFTLLYKSITKIIPIYLIVIPMICLVVVLLVLVSGLTKKKKPINERTSFQVKID